MLYIGADLIDDSDLPHRTSITNLILSENEREFQNLVLDFKVCTVHVNLIILLTKLQKSLGRISLTSDMWSDPKLDGFMGCTAHFMARNEDTGQLELRVELLSFHFVECGHSGKELADEYFKILEKAGILHKVSVRNLHFQSQCT